jgi:hypothetical protein
MVKRFLFFIFVIKIILLMTNRYGLRMALMGSSPFTARIMVLIQDNSFGLAMGLIQQPSTVYAL